ncbi:hypothetical protein C4552_00545 [Candidatus Parcubacteria bacterium]|nr:MAG: hypothetical protein C4552_00545 [Candidatus Parcubacteria bacterium]
MMLEIKFPDEKNRSRAAMVLRLAAHEVVLGQRWERLQVTDQMLPVLALHDIRYEIVSEQELADEAAEYERLISGAVLFDLREHAYPSRRGDSFRSLQVFECWVCRAQTNRVVMGGWPGLGVRAPCPNAIECWHHELESTINWSRRPHPESVKRELEHEIAALRAFHAADIKNDIAGTPDFALKRSVTNTMGHKRGCGCTHWLRW